MQAFRPLQVSRYSATVMSRQLGIQSSQLQQDIWLEDTSVKGLGSSRSQPTKSRMEIQPCASTFESDSQRGIAVPDEM